MIPRVERSLGGTMDKAEKSWKLRAETAEALLEAEREEVERLRAHIKELEAQLPDEEGGEEEPEPRETLSSFEERMRKVMLDDMFIGELLDPLAPQWQSRMLDKLRRKDQMPKRVAAEVCAEMSQRDDSVRIRLKLSDNRNIIHPLSRRQVEELRFNPRTAQELISEITYGFLSHLDRARDGDISPEVLRGSVGSVVMGLIEGRKHGY